MFRPDHNPDAARAPQQGQGAEEPPAARPRGAAAAGAGRAAGQRRDAEAANVDANPRPQQRRRGAINLTNEAGRNAFVDANLRVGDSMRTRRRASLDTSQNQPVQVMASVRDGVIGSIYLDNWRIRTTHYAGPAIEAAPTTGQQRFQIDEAEAFAEYLATHPGEEQRAEMALDHRLTRAQRRASIQHFLSDNYLQWASNTLRAAGGDPTQTPNWATQINTPDDAAPFDTDEAIPRGDTLFEITTEPPAPGRRGYHTSRGAPRSIELTRGDIRTLQEAVNLSRMERSIPRANDVFYNHVGSHAPDLARQLRLPEHANR